MTTQPCPTCDAAAAADAARLRAVGRAAFAAERSNPDFHDCIKCRVKAVMIDETASHLTDENYLKHLDWSRRRRCPTCKAS